MLWVPPPHVPCQISFGLVKSLVLQQLCLLFSTILTLDSICRALVGVFGLHVVSVLQWSCKCIIADLTHNLAFVLCLAMHIKEQFTTEAFMTNRTLFWPVLWLNMLTFIVFG